jgi:hypothetical protein
LWILMRRWVIVLFSALISFFLYLCSYTSLWNWSYLKSWMVKLLMSIVDV